MTKLVAYLKFHVTGQKSLQWSDNEMTKRKNWTFLVISLRLEVPFKCVGGFYIQAIANFAGLGIDLNGSGWTCKVDHKAPSTHFRGT